MNIEVLDGLTASDKIAANPSLGLLEGQTVKVVQSTPGYEPKVVAAVQ